MRRLWSGKLTDLLTVSGWWSWGWKPGHADPWAGALSTTADAHSPQQGEPGQFRNMSLLPILPTPTTLLYFILLELTDSNTTVNPS